MAGSLALLSLLSVMPADAAPRRASGPVCDPQTPVARKLPRHPRSFGGPLKQPSSHAMAGLQDITARVVRGNRAYLAVGVVAIQNDSPVTGTDAGDCLIPSLRPLERVRSLHLQPRSRVLSPRSPRGPPAFA
jgi:hypothetical protein